MNLLFIVYYLVSIVCGLSLSTYLIYLLIGDLKNDKRRKKN